MSRGWLAGRVPVVTAPRAGAGALAVVLQAMVFVCVWTVGAAQAAAQDTIPPPPPDSLGPPFTLTGRVLDALSGGPVIAAVIMVPELARQTQSNLDGRFLFAGFPPGTWEIVIEQLGYHTSQSAVTVSEGNGLEIRLRPDPVALEGLRIRSPSMQLLARRRLRSAYKVDHISPQEIEQAINPDPTAIFRWHSDFPVSNCLVGEDSDEYSCPVSVFLDEGRLLGSLLELQVYPAEAIHSMDWIPGLGQLRGYTRHFVEMLDERPMPLMPFLPFG